MPAESVTTESPVLREVTVTFFSGMVLKEVTIPETDRRSWAFTPAMRKRNAKEKTDKGIFVFMALLLSKQRYKEYALLKTIIYYHSPDQPEGLLFQ
jgi:hypothetical protein